jgi:chemotaxis protein MotB
MRSVKLSTVLAVVGLLAGVAVLSGCDANADLKLQNRTQQATIDSLTSELNAANMQLDQLKKRLAAIEGTGGVEAEALRQKIAALEEDLAKKKELIASMQDKLMGVSPLPVEVSTALEDFAKGNDMVEYDANRGIVKFKSDLVFEKGSDVLTPQAAENVRKLAAILNSDQAKQFGIIVAGHTDDIPIQKPDTRAKHPTNWHLSSHRAIAVLQIMQQGGVSPTRLSTRGFGEYRPQEPNGPNKTGNARNRRVEIYIVPAGA